MSRSHFLGSLAILGILMTSACVTQTAATKNVVRPTLVTQPVAGDSDEQVMQFVTARYGDYVRLSPPLNASTLILWIAPALVLIGGLALVMVQLRRRRIAAPPPLTPEEERRLSELTG